MADATFEGCRDACESEADCLQFSVANRSCKISKVAKLGHQTGLRSSDQVTSGWMMDRVKNFAKLNDKSCGHEDFVLP
jgi:hypothetical protein